MSCEWRDRVAGLEPDEEVERHLAGCAECRELDAGLREDQTGLRAAHTDPILPAHYAAVRARVLDAIVAQRRRRVRRLCWMGTAAAVLAVLLVLAPRPERLTVAEPLPVVAMPRPAYPPLELPVAKRPPAPPLQRRLASSSPTLVKLQTDDPNVLIYWIMDQQGD